MKKIFSLFFLINILTMAEISMKIYEPIRFKNVNTRGIASDTIIGEGTLEITTDNEVDDYGKKLVFNFPKSGLITNKKRWLKIEKYLMDKEEKDYEIKYKRALIKFYAIIDRNELTKGGLKAEEIEGEYIGYVPIIVSQYGKLIGKPVVLPEEENKPTILPIFPDKEEVKNEK